MCVCAGVYNKAPQNPHVSIPPPCSSNIGTLYIYVRTTKLCLVNWSEMRCLLPRRLTQQLLSFYIHRLSLSLSRIVLILYRCVCVCVWVSWPIQDETEANVANSNPIINRNRIRIKSPSSVCRLSRSTAAALDRRQPELYIIEFFRNESTTVASSSSSSSSYSFSSLSLFLIYIYVIYK